MVEPPSGLVANVVRRVAPALQKTSAVTRTRPEGLHGVLETLPTSFTDTREALRTLACFVIAPARKARTGHIGLVPYEHGFGTPPFDDGSAVLVEGDRLVYRPNGASPITTLHAA